VETRAARDVPGANLAVAASLEREHHRTLRATIDAAHTADALLVAAFPHSPEYDAGDVAHHYAGLDGSTTDLADDLRARRHNIHALMRAAYQRGEDGVLESLEEDRQSLSALAAYAIAVRNGRYPERVEAARRDEDEAPEL
jgi:hypothetical protein